MKYERKQFAVVTASESFREGWDRIFQRPTGASRLESKRAPRVKEA
jgi:hypothetical protein